MNDLVVKHNTLANASYSLSLTEQRLILLAIVNARQSGQGITTNDPLTISASNYATQFNTTRQASYLALKEATETLFNRYFSYHEKNNGHKKHVKSRWVSRIAYIDELAQVELIFSPDVVPLITRLEEHFTRYELEQVAGLSSAYAVRLYEMLLSQRGRRKTDLIDLPELRNRLGVAEDEYKRMHHFKCRVLDLAMSQINEHTDITASYEQHKQGRKIVGFSFTFKFKKGRKETQTEIPDLDTVVSEIDNKLIEQYVNANPELTRGKSTRQIIQQLKEVYPKAKITTTYK